MSCEYIYIYKGDDTDWNDEQLINVNINPASPSVDLSDMTATFILGSYTKSGISLAAGSFQIDLGAAVTGAFPYGAIMGIIKILDSQNRVKTVANQIPFYVTNEVITLQNQDLTISLPQVSIDITVGGTVSYNNLSNKPSINGVTVEGSHNGAYYNLADLDTTEAALNTKVNKSGDTMTGPLSFGDFSVSSDEGMAKIEGEQYGLRVDVTSGLGAALFTANGMGNVLTSLDVKSTYSSTGTDPVNGTAVASAISTKQDTIIGAATSITQNNLTSNKALISDGSGKVAVSNVTSTELGYVSGVTGAIQTQITNEVNARTNADNDLQGQIDAISASSDVTDIVGTYAELQSYDTQHLKDNDIIKVLSDSTHDDASTYYRWSTHTQTFTYIGAEGPYYTKSETDNLLSAKQNVISDLSAIRSGAELGSTSLQPSDVSSTYSATGTDPVNGTAVASAISTKLDTSAAASTYIPLTQKASANGVATLDSNTLIPSAQLPIIDGGNANA